MLRQSDTIDSSHCEVFVLLDCKDPFNLILMKDWNMTNRVIGSRKDRKEPSHGDPGLAILYLHETTRYSISDTLLVSLDLHELLNEWRWLWRNIYGKLKRTSFGFSIIYICQRFLTVSENWMCSMIFPMVLWRVSMQSSFYSPTCLEGETFALQSEAGNHRRCSSPNWRW